MGKFRYSEWEFDITEEDCEKTTADVSSFGSTTIKQETETGSGVVHAVDLSREQMEKVVRRFCALTGFDPNS